MKRFSIPAKAIGLPLAIFAAAVLIAINEASFQESSRATVQIEQAELARQSVAQVLQASLDTEVGIRGYMLTHDERYLAPYDKAAAAVPAKLASLRALLAGQPEKLADVEKMAAHISRRQNELAGLVRLHKTGDSDAGRRMPVTSLDEQAMQAIREQSDKLMLASQKTMLAAHAKIDQSLRLSRIGIAAMGLGGLLAFYMYLLQTQALLAAGKREQLSLQKERDRLEKQVLDRTARLAELATHLQVVREDERGHLARELHDELGALLTAAKLDVARIKARLGSSQPEAIERLSHLTHTLDSGIALKRRIVEDLRPSSLSHLGLIASLEILAREFADRSGLEIITALAPVSLGVAAQLTVYRLVQEALTNIGKHSKARRVDIRLRSHGQSVLVEVIDDGQGFDTANVAANQHGLAGMRHRVEASGGQLRVESGIGRGTLIQAQLPADPCAPEQPLADG